MNYTELQMHELIPFGCQCDMEEKVKREVAGDRKSVVQGKSVDLGGRRIIKKKTTQEKKKKKQLSPS